MNTRHLSVADLLQTNTRRTRGFTLIELMIAVAVIGLLVAVAYPSYQEHVRKANRAEAQAFLMDVAQRQQQYLLDSRRYADSIAALSMTVPTKVNTNYTVSVALTAGSRPGFTLTAAPKSGSAQAGDVTLTLDHTGAKTPANKW